MELCIRLSSYPENTTAGPVISLTGSTLQTINFYIFFYYLTGFFDDAKSDFQQALKLNPDFEDAKVSLQQTILDQQHKINRGYWRPHKLQSACFICPEIWKHELSPIYWNFMYLHHVTNQNVFFNLKMNSFVI